MLFALITGALTLTPALAQPQSALEPAAAIAGSANEYDCIVEPEEIVKLASPVVGVIASLSVDRGDIVHKGDVLGSLDSGLEKATLALSEAKYAASEFTIKSAEARLLFAKQKRARYAQLQAKALKSVADLEESEAEVNVAVQQLGEARANRDIAQLEVKRAEEIVHQRILRSPIDGIVMERLLVPGEYRNEQSPILSLARIDRLRVEVVVPTARYGQIKVGMHGSVRPEAPVGGSYNAVVTVVDRVIDAASGTFGVRLMLDNPDLALPSGLRCRVTFESSVAGDASK